MTLRKYSFCWSNKIASQADFYMWIELYFLRYRRMSFYLSISSEGEKGEVEQRTMHKYKLISGFIVHCAIKSMYYTQLFY